MGIDRKDEPLSVRGNTRLLSDTAGAQQLARSGAIFLGDVEVVSQTEQNAPIREQVCILSLDGAEAARFSRRQRYRPERKHELVARSAQQI